MTRKEYNLRDLPYGLRGSSTGVLRRITLHPTILPRGLRHSCDVEPDYGEAILRVGIALAILRTLDAGDLDIETLLNTIVQEFGLDAARLYFPEAIEGLIKGYYIRAADGRLSVTSKGAA